MTSLLPFVYIPKLGFCYKVTELADPEHVVYCQQSACSEDGLVIKEPLEERLKTLHDALLTQIQTIFNPSHYKIEVITVDQYEDESGNADDEEDEDDIPERCTDED